ncbi:MAG: hypothetical protein CTY35_02020 [Methylotenera sp.]|uniref:hypothetical protein n=1 Tax=Methylotenera sp. TaxID=2051956 RepID=UPI000D42C334|nr:hypothetical protein [Methylotenera sp.]PPC84401.1 MAG: hypothetical protein CTY38_02240 [Methylotenera sp.]PPD01043.1 MAG: hypothetical protein CTY35_02020 [Methylotenera sp.]
MSTKSLIVVQFGDCSINFRRHWGGDPVIVGSEMLDHLASAETIKPRSFFHTGSYLLRLMFADGYVDDGLPTYEAYITNDGNDGVYGDWEIAYRFECDGDGIWRVGYVELCDGEPWAELAETAKWFSPTEFREFIEQKYVKDQSQGITYDVQVKDTLLKQLRNPSKGS